MQMYTDRGRSGDSLSVSGGWKIGCVLRSQRGLFSLILISTQFSTMNYTLYQRPALAYTDSRLPLAFRMGNEGKGWVFVS